MRRRRAARSTSRARFAPRWSETRAEERAALLERAAELVEADRAELVARCVAETGKTIPDSLAEVREAVDLLRYYAARGAARARGADGAAGPDRRAQRSSSSSAAACSSA